MCRHIIKKNSGGEAGQGCWMGLWGMNVLLGKERLWGQVSDEMWDLTVAWGEGRQDHWLNQQGSELAAESPCSTFSTGFYRSECTGHTLPVVSPVLLTALAPV